MSKDYEYVKSFRRRTKDRIIESLGGKCVCCGYNKCTRALAVHHLDPNEKEFSFGGKTKDTPNNWNKLVKELRKCVLLCHNCHSEVHDNVTVVPQDAPRFNESFAAYEPLRVRQFDSCPICSDPKPKNYIVCSPSCAAKRKQKIDWDSIDIVSELEQLSMSSLARKLGCSDNAIRKRLLKISRAPET